MNIMASLFRRIFSPKPRVGDKVHGGLDFGSSYSGVVTSVQNLPEYEMCWLTVSGVVTIYPDWGDAIEKHDNIIVVPYHKCMKRATLS